MVVDTLELKLVKIRYQTIMLQERLDNLFIISYKKGVEINESWVGWDNCYVYYYLETCYRYFK